MSNTLIQEKQKIKVVSLSDVPEIIKKEYKRSLNVKSAEGMTFFYLINSNLIVINRDNVNHGFYETLITNYLSYDEVTRNEFRELIPANLAKSIDVLDAMIELQKVS